MKNIPAAIFIFCAIIAVVWIVQGNNFFLYRVFAPQYANVQREVFEQTAPYNEGMAQDLRRMQEEYQIADSDHKPALAEVILHNFASYDINRLPSDLRAFYNRVKNDSGLN